MASDNSTSDYKDLPTEVLSRILRAVEKQEGSISDVRERLIKLETHGYTARIESLEKEISDLKKSVIVLETQGKMFTAGVAAFVSAIVAFAAKWFGSGAPH